MSSTAQTTPTRIAPMPKARPKRIALASSSASDPSDADESCAETPVSEVLGTRAACDPRPGFKCDASSGIDPGFRSTSNPACGDAPDCSRFHFLHGTKKSIVAIVVTELIAPDVC